MTKCGGWHLCGVCAGVGSIQVNRTSFCFTLQKSLIKSFFKYELFHELTMAMDVCDTIETNLIICVVLMSGQF